IDAAVYVAGCVAILEADDWRVRTLAAVLLGSMALVEMVSGITPGKLLLGWRVRMPDGSRPAVWRFAVRAIVRLVPVGIALLSLLAEDRLIGWQMLAGAAMVGLCYLSACYIT